MERAKNDSQRLKQCEVKIYKRRLSMKTKSKRFVAVFFALTLAGVATLSHASDSGSPMDSTINVISDHDEGINHDGDGDQDQSMNHEPFPYDHDHRGPIDQCRQNDGNVYYCQQTPGCIFDEYSNICRSSGTEGGGQGGQQPRPTPQYCQQYNDQESECQYAGCVYDMSRGLCRAHGQIPQPGYRFVCNASDIRFEEHYSGHQGIGQSQYTAQQAAMGDCLRHHRSCRVTHCQRR